MNCARFERWLDEGMPGAGSAAEAALAHAVACACCGAALAAERALAVALSRAPAAAPAGFADRVMERVARSGNAQVAALAEEEALPWWAQIAAEPAAAIALALAALVLWQHAAISRLALAALRALGDPAVTRTLRALSEPRLSLDLSLLTHPFVLAGVMLALLPLAWWAGLAVYHWSGDPQPARARHV